MSPSIVRVRDVMHPEVLCVDGMASVKDAAAVMRANNIAELLVNKRNEDDAWGIITVMDLVKDVIVPGREGEDVSVYEVMTKPVITVPATMDIRYAIRLIYRTGVHRAPVEHLGEIVGMVTLSSLILDSNIV
ncbi:CBS domain-containing protein [Pseudodesulfovibrio nedwellii]|uniref:CBS domain-containing protein n=1 Tax=Pseudodesulfovibrio nedwellii TaxID=2973072 RepID=A0ABM8AYP8_9BACT|nr:CBS domain-containing protein [Pseudodesulfovibrio nedwellii]BDQ36646.1 CBS domain-containing protein [Pseudodesulfovibrio nedwellii]